MNYYKDRLLKKCQVQTTITSFHKFINDRELKKKKFNFRLE